MEGATDALHLGREEIYKLIEAGPTCLKIGKYFVRTRLEYKETSDLYNIIFTGYNLQIYEYRIIIEEPRLFTISIPEHKRFEGQYWATSKVIYNAMENTVVYDIIKWLQVLTKIGCFC